jgi:protein-tyrosine phosphatase
MVAATYMLGRMHETKERFKILFICTGNQCRSALAEVITRTLSEGLPVDVSSAGTNVSHSSPSPNNTLQAASMLGYDLGEHRSRPLRAEELNVADLVVGFEIAHVATAVIEWETERAKTWLLPQLVETLERIPVEPPPDPEDLAGIARSRLAAANALRSSAPPMLGDQIADPIGRASRVHQATARTIDDLCRRMVPLLFRASLVARTPQANERDT